jgi:hypothetical protein
VTPSGHQVFAGFGNGADFASALASDIDSPLSGAPAF